MAGDKLWAEDNNIWKWQEIDLSALIPTAKFRIDVRWIYKILSGVILPLSGQNRLYYIH